MNKSLASLVGASNKLLTSGFTGLVLGVVLFVNSGSSGSNLLFGYSLMILGSVLVPLGIIGRFLASTAKSIVEGLGGNFETKKPASTETVDVNSYQFKKMF